MTGSKTLTEATMRSSLQMSSTRAALSSSTPSKADGESGIAWMVGLWAPCYLGFCPDASCWDRYLKKIGVEDAPYPTRDDRREAHFSSFIDNRSPALYDDFGLVTISKFYDDEKHSAEAIEALIHESVHAFQFLADQMGERHPSVEFEAYGIQSIYSFMQNHYSRLRWRDGKKVKATTRHHSTAR